MSLFLQVFIAGIALLACGYTFVFALGYFTDWLHDDSYFLDWFDRNMDLFISMVYAAASSALFAAFIVVVNR